MPHLCGGMDYLGKGEVLTNTDLDRFVNNIWVYVCIYGMYIRDAPIRIFGADHQSPKAVSANPDIADHRS